MGFPDDRAGDFVLDFPTAVAPEYRNRSALATSPPLFVLRVPESAQPSDVDRVVGALRAALTDNGKLVPLAHVAAEDDSELLADTAGGRLMMGAPEHMTPDRYRHFLVMRDLIAYVRENPGAWRNGPQARNLRRHASERRAQRGGLLAFTRMDGPSPDGLMGFLMRISWLSFVQRLPKWLWARWTSRRMVRGWLGAERIAGGGTNLFRVMDTAGDVWSSQLRNDPGHEEALQQLDQLLFRALLEDLRSPAVGGVLPRRRRRTGRPVVLVELPPAGERGARSAERFLRSAHGARATARPPGPLVVAVGRPSEALLTDLGGPAELTFAQASVRLAEKDGPPVLVDLTSEALARPGLDLRKVAPRTFKFGWTVPTAIMTCASLLCALTAGGLITRRIVGDHGCAGGTGSIGSARAAPVPTDPKAWYDAAVREISVQNRRAEKAAAEGKTVRTVVAFESGVPTDENETRFDGTIPELRGIALWQRKLLDTTVSNDRAVGLRVDVRPTGRAFANAVPEAKRLAAQVRAQASDKNTPAYARVVGVLGYAQSRTETRDALEVLGAAGIPAIGTTATADEMSAGNASLGYWPFTPSNSTEARIEADFASGGNIVAAPGSGDDCSPARQALVIESSADLYSRSLADKFRAAFPGTSQVFDFNQDGRFDEPGPTSAATSMSSADDLARALCKALRAEPASVVYWSARARDFTAFIDAMDIQGTCIADDITVLGGNELTNVALTGAFNDKDWLRLYYSAHRLPVTDERASEKTRQFVGEYNAFVKRTTKGVDPWVQDGHSAVSYDAFHTLSQAVNQARQPNGEVPPQSPGVALRGGVTFDGATGWVSYGQGTNAPPTDKTLVLLRQFADHPEAVVVCGAYEKGASSREQGPPCFR